MKVLTQLKAQPTQDGDGVKIARVHDFRTLKLDPFLMIDELKSDDEADYMGGFPPHPHRGLETFTYIIKGGFEHQDQLGNKKAIKAGDVQWMSTGYGVVHSEMPLAGNTGLHGFQIWLNMPAKDKLRPAKYQDSTQSGLPEIEADGVTLKALAGTWQHQGQFVTSSINELAANGALADVTLAADAHITFAPRDNQQLLVYIHTGALKEHSAGTLLKCDPSAPLTLAASPEGAGVLLLAGDPLAEPVAHMGPFVMNTQAELKQAVLDYQAGRFGTIS